MTISDIETFLAQNPGDPTFVEHAESLRLAGDIQGALMTCLRGLSNNPSLHRGRLILARIYFELGFIPFAANEVKLLAEYLPENENIAKLLRKLAPDMILQKPKTTTDHAANSDIIAEADFDIDDIEVLVEEQGKKK